MTDIEKIEGHETLREETTDRLRGAIYSTLRDYMHVSGRWWDEEDSKITWSDPSSSIGVEIIMTAAWDASIQNEYFTISNGYNSKTISTQATSYSIPDSFNGQRVTVQVEEKNQERTITRDLTESDLEEVEFFCDIIMANTKQATRKRSIQENLALKAERLEWVYTSSISDLEISEQTYFSHQE